MQIYTAGKRQGSYSAYPESLYSVSDGSRTFRKSIPRSRTTSGLILGPAEKNCIFFRRTFFLCISLSKNVSISLRKIILLKISKITNFQFGSKWSQMELLMRSKVQNGSPRSTEAENKLFGAFPAEYPAESHDM